MSELVAQKRQTAWPARLRWCAVAILAYVIGAATWPMVGSRTRSSDPIVVETSGLALQNEDKLACFPGDCPQASTNQEFYTKPASQEQPATIRYAPVISAFCFVASLAFTVMAALFARSGTRAATFRQLRGGFAEFRHELPPGFWAAKELPSVESQRHAMVRYWYNAFDEWFVTCYLSYRIGAIRALWKKYYSLAIRKTCTSPAMIAAFMQAAKSEAHEVDVQFISEVKSWCDAERVDRKIAVKLFLEWEHYNHCEFIQHESTTWGEILAQWPGSVQGMLNSWKEELSIQGLLERKRSCCATTQSA